MKTGVATLLCSHVKKKAVNGNEQASSSPVCLQLPLKEGLVSMAASCLSISHINYFCKYNQQQAYKKNALHPNYSW